MNIFEDTNPRELKELLAQIHSKEAALPDFQRDFVWEPNATQELIVSIACNYPAGTLLRIRNTHNLFACRQFEGAPELNNHKPTYLVLDGQQRLTSLYQAFYGVGDHRYYLNIRKVLEKCEFEECVFYLRSNLKKAQQYESFDEQAKDLIMPLSILRGGAGDFGRWSRNVTRKIQSNEERVKLEDALIIIEEEWIKIIDDYRFPVVTLSDITSAEAVCTIFETLNRTGVKLSPFELLTARFWYEKVNLRDLWATALAKHSILQDFDIDPYYLLQVISLLSRPTASCKRGEVLDLKSSAITQWWEKAVEGMVDGLEMLRDECGVAIPNWLPYNTILNPLAAVLAKLEPLKISQIANIKIKLKRWFWCSVFGQKYENAPNSQTSKDVVELLQWIDGGKPPESVTSFDFNPVALRETTFRQRAVSRGIIALLMRHSPLDFRKNKELRPNNADNLKVDAYPIFPLSYFKESKMADKFRDGILNRALISRETYQEIYSKLPATLMLDIKNSIGDRDFQTMMQSHLLPAGTDSPLLINDFEAFIFWRQNAVWQEIQVVTSEFPSEDFKPIIEFPKVKHIVNDTIRLNVEKALKYLNEEEVDIGLFNLGRQFENTLKDFLKEGLTKGKVVKHNSMGNNTDSWKLSIMIDCAINNVLITDKGALHFLRHERNERAHGTTPSLEERRIMMSSVGLVAGLYIDYIKLFDDANLSL